jgi:CBS domain-containing protein
MDKNIGEPPTRTRSNPAAVYSSPAQVEGDKALSRAEKLAILKSWEEDARELQVAESENMGGGEPSRLDEVVAARVRVAESESGSADETGTRVGDLARPVDETLHADQEVDEAALRLSLQEIPFLPVIDGDEIVGVLTREHLAAASEAEADQSARISARTIMTSDLAFCYGDDDAATARGLMDRHGTDHLLVVDKEQALVGVLAREDLPDGDAKPAPAGGPSRQGPSDAARNVHPGGLDVYADRPKIVVPRT